MKKNISWGGRRKNAGAPAGNKNEKKKIKKDKLFLGIRVTKDNFKLIQKAVKKTGKTKSQFLYEALLSHVKK